MHPSIHHIALSVRDLSQAEHFYTTVLDLPVVKRNAYPNGAPRSVWLELGGDSLLMLEHTEQPPSEGEGAGWHLVALTIAPDERSTWMRRFESLAVGFQQSEHTLYIRDPEGNRIGLSHYPAPSPG